MTHARLEHVNITVSDPDATARWMEDVFGWKIRWQGDAINGGRTLHVGTEAQYVAIYDPKKPLTDGHNSYTQKGGLNHIAVTVDDLDAIEAKVDKLGFETHSHADYEPGRRFYFYDGDRIEYEVVSYS